MAFDVKKLLHTAAYHPIEIDRILDSEYPSFIEFDPELGYVLKDYIFRDGMGNTLSAYTYEANGGHQKMINSIYQPCL